MFSFRRYHNIDLSQSLFQNNFYKPFESLATQFKLPQSAYSFYSDHVNGQEITRAKFELLILAAKQTDRALQKDIKRVPKPDDINKEYARQISSVQASLTRSIDNADDQLHQLKISNTIPEPTLAVRAAAIPRNGFFSWIINWFKRKSIAMAQSKCEAYDTSIYRINQQSQEIIQKKECDFIIYQAEIVRLEQEKDLKLSDGDNLINFAEGFKAVVCSLEAKFKQFLGLYFEEPKLDLEITNLDSEDDFELSEDSDDDCPPFKMDF